MRLEANSVAVKQVAVLFSYYVTVRPSLCNSNAAKWIRYSWITLPLLSASHKVVHTSVLSCCSYFELIFPIIRYYRE